MMINISKDGGEDSFTVKKGWKITIGSLLIIIATTENESK